MSFLRELMDMYDSQMDYHPPIHGIIYDQYNWNPHFSEIYSYFNSIPNYSQIWFVPKDLDRYPEVTIIKNNDKNYYELRLINKNKETKLFHMIGDSSKDIINEVFKRCFSNVSNLEDLSGNISRLLKSSIVK